MTNPVQAAVEPLKSDAIARAEKEARAIVDRLAKQLADAGNDVAIVAPRPRTDIGRNGYLEMRSKRDMFNRIVRYRDKYRSFNGPQIADVCPELVERFVENSKRDAGLQYDAFVQKLVSKVGEATAAEIAGNHVWSRSTLTVTHPDGTTTRWRTQMIVNVSKLGLLFNQWPTRKVK